MANPARFLPSAAYRKAGILVVSHTLAGTQPATAGNYGQFFIAPYKCVVLKIEAVWRTASSSGTLNIERLQGTEAKDAGDDLLSSTIDLSGAAETVNTGTLISGANAAPLELAAGNRLGLVNGGTLTSGADLCVTVELAPIP